MNHLVKYGRTQFAIALIAFGIMHLIVRRIIMGDPPLWPTLIPGMVICAYLSGLFLVVTGILLLLNKNAVSFLIATAVLIFCWAFLRDVFIFIPHPVYNGFLTEMGEALALIGSCFIVANSLITQNKRLTALGVIPIGKLTAPGPILIGIFFLICGVQHFTLTKYVQTLVPSWIPGHIFWTYFAGVALIAGGVGLIWRRFRKQAAFWSGVMIFIWMLILHAPRVAVNIHNPDEWSSLLETMAFSAALFVLAGSITKSAESNPAAL